MPELPEVETTVRGLKNKIIGRKIDNIWTDWPKYFKDKTEKEFKKCVVGKTVKKVERKGKNILIYLSGDIILLVHQKMSGHFLIGKWIRNKNFKNIKDNEIWKNEKWIPEDLGSKFGDKKNKFIRLVFFLDNGDMLALSDLRRFAKVICGKKDNILNSKHLNLGPDPLNKEFKFSDFKKILKSKNKKIKNLLLDQKLISGIGNIYSDEALWRAKIHPLILSGKISDKKIKVLYEEIKKILKKGIKLKGTSIDDFRDVLGNKGKYGNELLVYQRDGEKCFRCGKKIEKIKVGSRSTRFCPKCQKK
jgi:formamidopyrimidine-DNA glycosylase